MYLTGFNLAYVVHDYLSKVDRDQDDNFTIRDNYNLTDVP